MTRREARDLVIALFGEKATVSLGTISNLERRTSEAIKPAYDEALDAIQNAEFIHCDETGWWQGSERTWLWTAVTPMLKVFRIDPRRNREAFLKLLFAFEDSSSRIATPPTGDSTRRSVSSAGRI